VYALGAILYECLTGQPPFRGATLADLLEQVRTREPVAPRELARKVPPDLQTICLHCLRKEPERRYVSAGALAEDLRRFQEGRPIAARPVGNVERAWRWCRRNPRWAATLAAVAVLLCGVTGVSLYAYAAVSAMNRNVEEKNEALRQSNKDIEDKSKAILKEMAEKEKQRLLAEKRLVDSLAMVTLFAVDARSYCEDAIVPGESKKLLYDVLLKHLKQQVEVGDAAFDEDRARSKIVLYQQIAIVNVELGNAEEAKKWHRKGLEAANQWVRARPGDPAAESHRAAYLHLVGTNYEWDRDLPKAMVMYKEAFEVRKRLLGNPEVDKFTPGKSYINLADSMDTFKLFDESLKLREEAYRKFKTPQLLDAWVWTHWKASWNNDDYYDRKKHLTRACELSAELHKKRPTGRIILSRWVSMLRELGELEYNRGNWAEAKKQYTTLAEVTRKLTASDLLVGQRQVYARSWYTLGLVEQKLGNAAEARKHFQRCLQVREELLRDYPNYPSLAHLKIDWLFALVALDEPVRAIKVADEICAEQARNSQVQYRLACIYSLSIPALEEARRPMPLTAADRALQAQCCDKALGCLDRSLAHGNREFYTVAHDSDLHPIRSDPRFKQIVAKYKK
jgi:tetratricopeptide (TPR) repeat protein